MVNPFDFNDALDSMVILVDTREQPTVQAQRRYAAFGNPYERQKLDFGDYSAKFKLPSGEWFSLENSVVVERKMNIDELCMCFCHQRERFEREFERIKAAGAKCYLLVEGAAWEKFYNGQYRSKMTSNSLVASTLAFCARYGIVPVYCKMETSGKLIRDILYREGKERLEVILDDERISGSYGCESEGKRV